MIGASVFAVVVSTVVGQLSPSDARRAGELTRLLDALIDQVIVIAGGGALLGLGLGVLSGGVGVYLYKRRQIRAKLQ